MKKKKTIKKGGKPPSLKDLSKKNSKKKWKKL